jgi:hypothetical protein
MTMTADVELLDREQALSKLETSACPVVPNHIKAGQSRLPESKGVSSRRLGFKRINGE